MAEHPTANPWLSVTIPAYNAEQYLSRCMDSIMCQTFRDFEVIIVDDGSTDSTPAIAQSYAANDARVKVLSKANGGCLMARLDAARQARGEYVLFADADDYYCSRHAFRTMRETIGTQSYDLLQFGYYKKYNHLKIREKKPYTKLEVNAADFRSRDYARFLSTYYGENLLDINVWNKLYHRRLLQDLPLQDAQNRIFYGEDILFNLHVLRHCRSACYISKPLYAYCMTVGMSHSSMKLQNGEGDYVMQRQLEHIDTWDGDNREELLRHLFVSSAGGLFLQTKRFLLGHNSPEDTTAAVQAMLNKPSYLRARDFFCNQGPQSYLPAELLRRGDARAYVQAAQEALRSCSLRSRLMQSIIRLLKRI